MNYLLDTCVLSEARRGDAAPALLGWLEQVSEDRLFLSSLVIGEIQQGVAALSEGRRKRTLQEWLEEGLLARFAGRILPVDEATAQEWGILRADAKRNGEPAPVIDGLIAATAIRNNLTVVTRNVRDFSRFPVRLLDPWAGA